MASDRFAENRSRYSSVGTDAVKLQEPISLVVLRRFIYLAPLIAVAAAVVLSYPGKQTFHVRLHRNGDDSFIDVATDGETRELGSALSPLLNCTRLVRRRTDPELEPCRVFHSSGVPISTLKDLSEKHQDGIDLYLVPPGRHFMWPSVDVGHRVHADHVSTADGRTVVVETLSMSPRVFRMHHVLSEAEIDQILSEMADARKKSVSERYRSNINVQRTGEDWNADVSETVRAVRQRLRAVLGMDDVPDSWSEPLEMLVYGPGKCFTLHDDYIDEYSIVNQEFDVRSELLGSNRYATAIFYFNDVELGGETVFAYGEPVPGLQTDDQDAVIEAILSNATEAALIEAAGIRPGTFEMSLLATCRSRFSVKPKRGSVVVFYNQLPEGGIDHKALHGGCPVLKGEKIAANIITWNGPTNLASEAEISEMLSQKAYCSDEQLGCSHIPEYRNSEQDHDHPDDQTITFNAELEVEAGTEEHDGLGNLPDGQEKDNEPVFDENEPTTETEHNEDHEDEESFSDEEIPTNELVSTDQQEIPAVGDDDDEGAFADATDGEPLADLKA